MSQTLSFTRFFEEGLVGSIFIYIRNLMYCALIFSAGTYVHAHPPDWIEGFISRYWGYPLIFLGLFLMLLNLIDGYYQLAKRQFKWFVQIAAAVFHTFISIRLAMVLWYINTR
jgi:hypothetical protein